MAILLKLALLTRFFSLAFSIPTTKNDPPSSNQFLFQGNVVEVNCIWENICSISALLLCMLGATNTVTTSTNLWGNCLHTSFRWYKSMLLWSVHRIESPSDTDWSICRKEILYFPAQNSFLPLRFQLYWYILHTSTLLWKLGFFSTQRPAVPRVYMVPLSLYTNSVTVPPLSFPLNDHTPNQYFISQMIELFIVTTVNLKSNIMLYIPCWWGSNIK